MQQTFFKLTLGVGCRGLGSLAAEDAGDGFCGLGSVVGGDAGIGFYGRGHCSDVVGDGDGFCGRGICSGVVGVVVAVDGFCDRGLCSDSDDDDNEKIADDDSVVSDGLGDGLGTRGVDGALGTFGGDGDGGGVTAGLAVGVYSAIFRVMGVRMISSFGVGVGMGVVGVVPRALVFWNSSTNSMVARQLLFSCCGTRGCFPFFRQNRKLAQTHDKTLLIPDTMALPHLALFLVVSWVIGRMGG